MNDLLLSELYVSILNRAPDAAGLAYWVNELTQGTITLEQLGSNWMNEQPEVVALYPSTLATDSFIDAIYQNVLGRSAEAAGLIYWSGELENGNVSRSVFVNAIINGAKAASGSATDAAYLNNRAEVGLTFAAANLNDSTVAHEIESIVTSDPETTAAASAIINLVPANPTSTNLTAITSIINHVSDLITSSPTAITNMVQYLETVVAQITANPTASVANVLNAVTSVTASAAIDTTILGSAISLGTSSVTSPSTIDSAIEAASTATVIHTQATTGIDTISGTAANDVFVAVGITAAGQYSGSDSNFTDLTTINNSSTSQINSGDSFDGGAGYNVLHVYGMADLSGVTLTNIQKIILHSDVTFTDEQINALNAARASIEGDGSSIMRVTGAPGATADMSNIQLQAIGQFDLAQSLTAQISQLGLDQIGTVAVDSDAYLQADEGSLDFSGKTVYGDGSVKDANGVTVGTLDQMSGVTTHLNTVVTSVASLVDSMNTLLAGVPGYTVQDTVNLDVANMNLYLGSQTASDVIMAGNNSAFLRGGSYNDTIMGGNGTNFISGAAGDDTITGGALRDFIAGDEGNDTVYGLAGNDFINTQGGNDTITGGAGQDFIMPGDGADTVIVDNSPDFISLYSSTTPSTTDGATDVVKFTTNTALIGGPNVIVGFESANDVLKFESTISGSGITGITASNGIASISSSGIVGFNMSTAAPGGILILTDNSFIRGDAASANDASIGYDTILAMAGTLASPGVGQLIAVNDGGGNTNIFYDIDGSSVLNNWQFAVKIIGVSANNLNAASLQIINENT